MLPGEVLKFISLFNWIDWLVGAIIIYFIIDGWNSGFIHLFASFAGYAGSIWLAIKYNTVLGHLITEKIGFGEIWANILGYIIIILFFQITISQTMLLILNRMARYIMRSILNNILGTVLGLINGLAILSFIFLIILALPIRGNIQEDIRSSIIAPKLVRAVEKYGGSVKSLIDNAATSAIKFVTITPKSNEVITLDIQPQESDLKVDEQSERKMLELINDARIRVGIVPLENEPVLVAIARNYSRQIFVDRYFSHFDKNGKDVVFRVGSSLEYKSIGENLAYAPNVEIANKGLLESSGHRKNILDPSFTHIGIGIIDSGLFGRVFTQIFIQKPYIIRSQ